MKTTNSIKRFVLVTFAAMLMSNAASAGVLVRTGNGANAAAIQPAINQFRIDLGGVNNGDGGHSITGRREVNWDDVPDASAMPNFLSPDFFNTVIPRGLVMNTLEFETGSGHNDFMVSADSSNPTTTPVEFGDLNSTYPGMFTPFSGQRIFAPRLTSMMEVHFFIPGTSIPATVKGFGVVFLDTDSTLSGQRSIIRCYDKRGVQIGSAATGTFNNGMSFLGMGFTGADRAARCTIEAGNVRLQADTFDGQNSFDVVAMDDFIFGEPQAASYHQGDFDGDGSADLNIYRPTTNEWFIFHTGTNTIFQTVFGEIGDEPVNGDFDGDGRGDVAVFRSSTGEWFQQLSSGGFTAGILGAAGDRPVPGDYDRDGKTDLAVWRPSDGTYLVNKSGGGTINTIWGQTGDIPINASSGKAQ